ncbi:MAG: serine/threonine-protein kinase [Myxococcota bacterium]
MSDDERRRGGSKSAAAGSRLPSSKGKVDPGLLDEVGLPEAIEGDPLASRPSRPSQAPPPRPSKPPVESQVRRPRRTRSSLPPRRPKSRKMPKVAPPATPESVRKPGQMFPTGEKKKKKPVPDTFGHLPVETSSFTSTDLPVIGEFGSYDVLGRLAMGGMAEILLGRKKNDDTPVVLKKILAHFARDDDFRDMFLDEARIGSALDHPNICRFLDWGEVDDDQLYIAMEWVNGVTLGRTIRRGRDHGGIPVIIACEIVAQVADALHYAHTARNEEDQIMGLVHRDVSPHNVMLAYDGSVKLLDFGIAKAQVQSHQTQAGVVKGKFAYMAPEQCRGENLDFRIDIFALGVVLYETMTGRSLYRRDSEAETMRAIVEGPIPSLHERLDNPPRELEAIVRTALAKKPENRFPTAAAMRDVLRSYLKKRKPVQRSHVAAMVQHFFSKDFRKGPAVDTTPFGSSYHTEAPRPTLAPRRKGAPSEPIRVSGAREIDLGGADESPLEPVDGATEVVAPSMIDSVDAALAGAPLSDPQDSNDDLPLPDLPVPDFDSPAAGAEPAPAPAAAPLSPESLDGILLSAPDLAAPEVSKEDLATRLANPRALADDIGPKPQSVPPAPMQRSRRASSRPPRPAPAPAPASSGAPTWIKALVVVLLMLVVGGVAATVALQPSEGISAGTVTIRTEPPGARVLFGNRPPQATPLTLENVAPGTYNLMLQSAGHETHRQQVQVGTDQGIVIDVRLTPLAP